MGNCEPNQTNKWEKILKKNQLMKILESSKLQPRQRAIIGSMLTH